MVGNESGHPRQVMLLCTKFTLGNVWWLRIRGWSPKTLVAQERSHCSCNCKHIVPELFINHCINYHFHNLIVKHMQNIVSRLYRCAIDHMKNSVQVCVFIYFILFYFFVLFFFSAVINTFSFR